jgi:hypothetical protein
MRGMLEGWQCGTATGGSRQDYTTGRHHIGSGRTTTDDLLRTESQDPCICREKSDLSMSAFRTYSEQCQPAYLVVIAKLVQHTITNIPKEINCQNGNFGLSRLTAIGNDHLLSLI